MEIFNYEAKAGFGIVFPAKSFIVDDNDFKLIISPGPFDEELISKLQGSDKQLFFVSPNNFHHLYLPYCAKNFNNARFFGGKRAAKQSSLALEKIDTLPSSELIQTVFIEGNHTLNETCFLIKEDKALIVTDLFFNIRQPQNLATKFAMKLAGTHNKVGTSRLLKITIKDRERFKNSLRKLLSLEFDTVYPNHGEKITREEFTEHLKTTFDI